MNEIKSTLTMTINQASEYSGIGRNTLRKLIMWQKIPVIKIGNKTLIRTEILDDFLRINDGKNLKKQQEIVAI